MHLPNQDSHYINGQWQFGLGNAFSAVNPATGESIWQGREANENEVILAYQAAANALSSWRRLSLAARISFLQKFADIVAHRKENLATLISLETGKPLWESVTEVNAVIGKVNISIEAFKSRSSTQQVHQPDGQAYVTYKPHGVVAVLGPFNFPAHLSNGHIVPAILAGNTVIYKPSELTPTTAAFIMQCWHDTGLPIGVINCIQGGIASGQYLLQQPIHGVYFTGSYKAGVAINTLFGTKPEVILALEMGGNNPLVIDNALQNIPAAIYTSLLSVYLTAGQRCSCARRMLIPNNSFGDEFLKQFITASQRLQIGAYTDRPEPFMGPVIRHEHAMAHLQAQEKLLQIGGVALLKMTLVKENLSFLTPGIVDMTVATSFSDEEIFAPLVQVYRYDNFEQALLLANQTQYGLVASLLSDDKQHYQQFNDTIRTGLIYWNRPTTGANSYLPFGGVGRSGNHRPSAFFAADYCSYPIACIEQDTLTLPSPCLPGIADDEHI